MVGGGGVGGAQCMFTVRRRQLAEEQTTCGRGRYALSNSGPGLHGHTQVPLKPRYMCPYLSPLETSRAPSALARHPEGPGLGGRMVGPAHPPTNIQARSNPMALAVVCVCRLWTDRDRRKDRRLCTGAVAGAGSWFAAPADFGAGWTDSSSASVCTARP